MPGLAQKEITQLLKHVERQGVESVPTNGGWLLKLPNGEQTVLHKTESDWRAGSNLRARLRRAGITWPGEEVSADGLPQYITKGSMSDELLARWRAALPDDADQVDVRKVTEKVGPPGNDFKQAYRALYRLGWLPLGHGIWARVKDKPVPEKVEPPTRALRAVEQDARDFPEITKAIEQAAPGREFLDTVDSWVLTDLGGSKAIPLGALEALLNSAGLEFEIRVWRKS